MLRYRLWIGQHTVFIAKSEERGHLEDVVEDGRIALIGCLQNHVGANGVNSPQNRNHHRVVIKFWRFLDWLSHCQVLKTNPAL